MGGGLAAELPLVAPTPTSRQQVGSAQTAADAPHHPSCVHPSSPHPPPVPTPPHPTHLTHPPARPPHPHPLLFRAGRVTPAMLDVPRQQWRIFLAIGCVEAMSAFLHFVSAANLPGVVLPLLSQTVLFWQVGGWVTGGSTWQEGGWVGGWGVRWFLGGQDLYRLAADAVPAAAAAAAGMRDDRGKRPHPGWLAAAGRYVARLSPGYPAASDTPTSPPHTHTLLPPPPIHPDPAGLHPAAQASGAAAAAGLCAGGGGGGPGGLAFCQRRLSTPGEPRLGRVAAAAALPYACCRRASATPGSHGRQAGSPLLRVLYTPLGIQGPHGTPWHSSGWLLCAP